MNLSSALVYEGTGSNLQTAIDEAQPGTKLGVTGLCIGNFTIAKNLKLIGWPTSAYPTPTMNGNAADTVLRISVGSVVLKDLTITNGYGNGHAGGGITNGGTLTLRGSTSVVANATDEWGGGIVNGGTLIMNGASTVRGNKAGGVGGGIEAVSVTMNDSSSVVWNRSRDCGGGIVGTDIIMNAAAVVRGNYAAWGAEGSPPRPSS